MKLSSQPSSKNTPKGSALTTTIASIAGAATLAV